jgi:glycerol-3-phosphate acyltransferase PlsY
MISALIWASLGYLLGALPFAYLITLWVAKKDIRNLGSGNVGATNAFRVLGMKWAAVVFLLDLAKGALFVGLLLQFAPPYAILPAFTQLMVTLPVWGHCYSPFLKFKGGRGVATTAGVAIMLSPWAVLSAAVAYGVVVKLTKESFKGSLTALAVFLMIEGLWVKAFWWGTLGVLTALIVWNHRTHLHKWLGRGRPAAPAPSL